MAGNRNDLKHQQHMDALQYPAIALKLQVYLIAFPTSSWSSVARLIDISFSVPTHHFSKLVKVIQNHRITAAFVQFMMAQLAVTFGDPFRSKSGTSSPIPTDKPFVNLGASPSTPTEKATVSTNGTSSPTPISSVTQNTVLSPSPFGKPLVVRSGASSPGPAIKPPPKFGSATSPPAFGSSSMFSKKSELSPPRQIYNPFIFKNGDLDVKVTFGNMVLVGSVCSQAMILASPAWATLIQPLLPKAITDDREKSSSSAIQTRGQLDLASDDGYALWILLDIVHLQFAKVPNETIPNTLMTTLANLCHKYQCVEILRPWLSSWLPQDLADWHWLPIAWIFGGDKTFDKLAAKIVKAMTVDEGVISYEDIELNNLLAKEIIDSLIAARNLVIARLLNAAYGKLSVLEGKPNNKDSVLAPVSEDFPIVCVGRQTGCDSIVYGSLIRSLISCDLWPRKSVSSVSVSVNTLAEKLRGLRIEAYCSSVTYLGPKERSTSEGLGTGLKSTAAGLSPGVPATSFVFKPCVINHYACTGVDNALKEISATLADIKVIFLSPSPAQPTTG